MGRLIGVAVCCCVFFLLYGEQSVAAPLNTQEATYTVTESCVDGENGTNACSDLNASPSSAANEDPDSAVWDNYDNNPFSEKSSVSSSSRPELGTLALLGLGLLGLGVVRHRVAT